MTQHNKRPTPTNQENTCQPCYPQMPYPCPPNAVEEDEIDLAELWASLAKRKKLILSFTFGITILVAVLTLFMTPKYESEVLMAPVSSGSDGGLSSLAAKYGGLASMAGISLPGGSKGSMTEEAIAVLQSKKFLADFILSHNLKPILFYKNWDAEHQQWRNEESFLQPVKNTIKSIIGVEPSKKQEYPGQEQLAPGEPSMTQAIALFKDRIMSVSSDKKTGMYTLKITWVDPVLARDWANELVTLINSKLRQQAINDAEKTINYLKQQLESVTLVELKQVIYNIIEEKVKSITLAKVQEEYVFKVIDPAIVPDEPFRPKKGLIVAVSFVLSLMLSIFIALILNWKENAKQEKLNETTEKESNS